MIAIHKETGTTLKVLDQKGRTFTGKVVNSKDVYWKVDEICSKMEKEQFDFTNDDYLQSKMNVRKSILETNYRKAFHYLKQIEKYKWHEFSEIPNDISFEVINILDSGYNALHDVYFDENYQCFKIVRN